MYLSKKVVIVLPAYNASLTLEKTYNEIPFDIVDDVILVDDVGNEIKNPGEIGHIVVRLDRWRAPGLFPGYIGNPEKMEKVVVDNYYYTGDRALFDEDGYWWTQTPTAVGPNYPLDEYNWLSGGYNRYMYTWSEY